MTTFITLCVAGYLLWTAAYLLYERHERRKRQREREETLPRKIADAGEILGKSTFSLCHSTPQVPEKTETVKPEDEADTFAAESERYPKVVSADELDALFAEGGLEPVLEPVEGQDEPMEYRDTDAGEPPIDEDEMLEGHEPKAAGLRFEDMGLAVRVAMDDRAATDEERLRAGQALAGLQGTPMFDQLTAGDAERERRIASLIELHLADYRRMQQPEPPAESIVPGDFSIDDIV